VINGSYFSRHGVPTTPFLSDRTELGPTNYVSQHGALVASAGSARIRDLAHEDWQTAFAGADDALVSYPMLIDTDGRSRAGGDSRWLANRSFVGQDGAGKIIFGTTAEAFFSISRLADFLRSSPLGLTLTLNLDGGPVACQGVKLGDCTRDFCGKWEFAFHDGRPELLEAAVGDRRWGLPVVVAVLPR
jgi:hypothetical protein